MAVGPQRGAFGWILASVTKKCESFKKRSKKFGAFFVATCIAVLTGCAGGGSAFVQSVQLVGQQMFSGAENDGLPRNPDPRFLYLRVDIPGLSPAMWVLGYIDASPLGEVEVWYSASNQVMKLQNGRIVSTRGLAADWPATRFLSAPPSWEQLMSTQCESGAEWEREHDELPAYRYGVRERVASKALVRTPAIELPASLPADIATRYRWVQETATAANRAALTSWYAWGLHLGRAAVVYSEQCLKPDFCVRMQRWPAQEDPL